jgi:hypothetical protein
MPDDNAFARGFVELLRTTGFPARFTGEQILQQTHMVVTALADAVTGALGNRLTQADLAAQGGRTGGGGPHHWDLLYRFSLESGAETVRITNDFLHPNLTR